MSTTRETADDAEDTGRVRVLRAAWAMIEADGLPGVTMAKVAAAAGVSRQTVYVQFGTRAGLLTEMVRERDAVNPRGERVAAAAALDDPVEALVAMTRELAGWWRDIHPIAQALFAAALTDEAAKAAWEDRMEHLHAIAATAVRRLAEADALASGWTEPEAVDWLAAELNPIGWVLLVQDRGWSQEAYEQRLAAVVRDVLVAGAD